MGFFSKLFGRDKGPPPEPPGRDVEALASPLSLPAVHVVATDVPSTSQLGGTAVGPPGFIWPTHNGKPLAFLAKIDLTDVQRCQRIAWLPQTGALLFFYNVEEQPWGFDPKDRGGWSVVHVEKPEGLRELSPPSILDQSSRLRRQFVTFRRMRSFPSYERDQVAALRLTEAESDQLFTLQDREFDGHPRHQMTGYPVTIQSDTMEVECQLASNGIYLGDSNAYKDPRAKELEAGASEWRLLFQVDSDDASDVMWGDVGTIYFWIRQSDAEERRFDRAWLSLQCH